MKVGRMPQERPTHTTASHQSGYKYPRLVLPERGKVPTWPSDTEVMIFIALYLTRDQGEE